MDSAKLSQLKQALDRLPRIPLVEMPTPVRKLARAFPGLEVWLKDDSHSHPIYGGNKPRKLEYLLARVKNKKQSVVTFGFESSNHAVATVYHCSQHGIPCHLVLVRGPEGMAPSDEALKEKKLALMRSLATSIETVDNYPQAARAGTRKWLLGLGKIRLIPPGGSNALGTLGYVRAALELAEQIERGELPPPKAIFVPLGTSGTAVGLAIGLAAAGLPTKVFAVKVVPGKINELPRLRWLARQVGKLVRELPRESLTLLNLAIEGSELGAGYGKPTKDGLRAVERWLSEEGVKLEPTYSGKAAAVLERYTGDGENLSPILFWLTYSEYRGQ
ncbi:MAG: pyridoxal-phosphate dependent enzyme [Deltaproteobacteria bacterium]|nr:pyridoxal-phosphate dependent enzyme [Deltaproteobacteria bacterium]